MEEYTLNDFFRDYEFVGNIVIPKILIQGREEEYANAVSPFTFRCLGYEHDRGGFSGELEDNFRGSSFLSGEAQLILGRSLDLTLDQSFTNVSDPLRWIATIFRSEDEVTFNGYYCYQLGNDSKTASFCSSALPKDKERLKDERWKKDLDSLKFV